LRKTSEQFRVPFDKVSFSSLDPFRQRVHGGDSSGGSARMNFLDHVVFCTSVFTDLAHLIFTSIF
jgi:hypothetical protein